MIFLAADIGATRSRLLIGEAQGGVWRALRRETLASADFPGIEDLLARFLRPRERTVAACLALAGPVEGEVARMTNLPWRVDAAHVAGRFGLRRVRLINDFAAQAHGLSGLAPAALHTLQAGVPVADAPRALIGAGTGLGMTLVMGADAEPTVLPSEGGHADFAPADGEQVALLQHLLTHHGRVSLETVLSGPGLERVYGFVAGLSAEAPPPLDAGAIGAAGLAGEPVAAAALGLFARIYASAAGNLTLAVLPRGGVYLSGGIAPKILPFLAAPEPLAAFHDKPPMGELLKQVPLHVVMDDLLGLHGAAQVAAGLAREPD
jgi:glucokinase